jgi:hypothetical protein
MKIRNPVYAVTRELILEAATLILRRVRRRARNRFQVSVLEVSPGDVCWDVGFEGDCCEEADAWRTVRFFKIGNPFLEKQDGPV